MVIGGGQFGSALPCAGFKCCILIDSQSNHHLALWHEEDQRRAVSYCIVYSIADFVHALEHFSSDITLLALPTDERKDIRLHMEDEEKISQWYCYVLQCVL